MSKEKYQNFYLNTIQNHDVFTKSYLNITSNLYKTECCSNFYKGT